MEKGAGAVEMVETEGGNKGWLGSAWAWVEAEAREAVGDWCWAGWGLVFSEGPSDSDPLRPG